MNLSAHRTILEAAGISKSYRARKALSDVSVSLHAGEIVGLLGPNGAGKTTMLSILSTQLSPDSGRVLVDGKPPGSARVGRMLGLVPQSLALYPTLSARQNLTHFARMQGLSRAAAGDACASMLEEVGLSDRADDAVRSYSAGMKRRLNLACGMVHRPAVLMLDEPTVGVDLQSRERILSLVRRAAEASSAVIYSTHYMEEAERLCDRVLLIDRGRLIAEGAVEEMIALAGGRPRLDLTYRGSLPEHWIDSLGEVREITSSEGEGKMALEMQTLTQVDAILQGLRVMNINVIDFSLHSPNLSDAFIALTGRTLRDVT